MLPPAPWQVRDAFSKILKSRGVRAALVKHGDVLRKIFAYYCRAEKGATSAGNDSMNLGELMIMYKELGLLDEACTAREVSTFFVKVREASPECMARGAVMLDRGRLHGVGVGTGAPWCQRRIQCGLRAVQCRL